MKSIYLSSEDYSVLKALTTAREPRLGALTQLSSELARAVVVDRGALSERVVRLGSVVEIEDADSGERDTYTLCLPWMADADRGMLSVLAPIGTAILGYAENDEIEWQTPGGKRRLRLRSVVQPAVASVA
jgi:regulator of nucleoside diphosphate kinase